MTGNRAPIRRSHLDAGTGPIPRSFPSTAAAVESAADYNVCGTEDIVGSGSMIRRNRASVAALTLAFSVLILSIACGVPDGNHPSTGSVETTRDGQCRQFESFSGQLRVGNPPPASTGLVPMPPGEHLPAPARPTLDSVDLKPIPTAATVTFGLGGDGSMGWSARFIQMPFLRGTDGAVPVAGTCILQIDLTSVDSTHVGASPGQPMRLTPDDDASAVVEVLSYPSSDTVTQSFVGTRSSTPEVTVGTSVANRAITFTITH
ncbi:AMIN-like domain-containing (lipo)protein [Rhodococcus opacus]